MFAGRRWWTQAWVCVFVACFCSPVAALAMTPGAAQGPVQIQQLRVQVMPEFDDPRVLVIVQGRLAETDLTFPLDLTFRLPREAQINQMATMDIVSGGTTSQPFESAPDPEDARGLLVTYSLDNAHFFYEYYYDPIVGEVDKHFDFAFSSLYPVQNLLLEVQQPRTASNFGLVPPAAGTRTDDSLGLAYHQINVGPLAAGAETTLTVSYAKADPLPSISREQVMGMQMPPAAAENQGAGRSLEWWPVALAAAVALGVLAGFTWRRSGSDDESGPWPEIESGGVCPHCGTVPRADARFCHICGSPWKAGLEQRGLV